MVHPYLRRRGGAGGSHLSQRGSRGRAEAHARRADLPGTGDATGHRRRGLHAGRGRPVTPRHGGVEAQGRARALRGTPHPGHARSAGTPRSLPAGSSSRSSGSANTDFRSRMPPVSRCWSMSPPGSSAMSPRRSAAALINSQPMGFYAPSQLVQDAQRHGVEVRPIDVRVSNWDCALEPGAEPRPTLRCALGCAWSRGCRPRPPRVSSTAREACGGFDDSAAAGRASAARSARTRLPGRGGRASKAWRPSPSRRLERGRRRGAIAACCRKCASAKASRCCARRVKARTSWRTMRTPVSRCGGIRSPLLRPRLEAQGLPELGAVALDAARLHGAHGGARDHPAAAGQRRGSHVRDARRRVRLDQPDRLA